MAAIAHSLLLLLSLAAVPLPREVVAEMADELASASPSAFMRNFSSSMEGYADLKENIESLDAAYDFSSSIQVLEEKESSVLVDWYLELKPKSGTGELIRRRERVRLEFRTKGKRLEVIRLQPMSLFSLP